MANIYVFVSQGAYLELLLKLEAKKKDLEAFL